MLSIVTLVRNKVSAVILEHRCLHLDRSLTLSLTCILLIVNYRCGVAHVKVGKSYCFLHQVDLSALFTTRQQPIPNNEQVSCVML